MASGLGEDIKEVLAEIGTSIAIIKDTGNISGEYVRLITNRQVTKPFIREFFQEANLSYDTQVNGGDVIRLEAQGTHFLVMNKIGIELEDEVYKYDSTLYKANVKGEILRPSGEDWSVNYSKTDVFQVYKQNVYALLTEALYGNDLLDMESAGQLLVENNELYISGSIGIKTMDRFKISGESKYYKVEAVKSRRYNGVDVAQVTEDSR